jgi:hypothetical protein
VLRGTYDPLPETYSAELRDVVCSMLTKDTRGRPTSHELLQVCARASSLCLYAGVPACLFSLLLLLLLLVAVVCFLSSLISSLIPTLFMPPQHPVIVARVQAYLNELSAAGGSGSWSTWKMKLPPGEQRDA